MDVWESLKPTFTGNMATFNPEVLKGENISFRVAPCKNNDKISSQLSAASNVVFIGKSDNITLLAGIAVGAVAFLLVISFIIVLLMKRFKSNKAPMDVKKEFIYNPQPYSLHYGQHVETTTRQLFPHR